MKTFFLFFLGIFYLFLANEMETAIVRGVYFFVAIGLLIVGAIRYLKERYESIRRIAEQRRESEEALKNIPHTQCTVSSDCLHALLLNEKTNTLYLANKEDWDADVTRKEIQFNKIYEVAIVEDKKIITANTKNGLLGGSLLGEGGNFSIYMEEEEEDSEEDKAVSKLMLKMVVDDLDNPIVEYVFMEKNEPIEKNEEEYKEILKLCEQWYQKISIIIKRYENDRVPVGN